MNSRQTIPADAAAKFPKRNVETTQVPVNPVPDKPAVVTTRSALLLPTKEIEDRVLDGLKRKQVLWTSLASQWNKQTLLSRES